MSDLTRRAMLGMAAVAAGSMVATADGAADADERKKDELPTFRYAMEEEKGRATEGGSIKHATFRELPISKAIAGASVHLKPGGVRDLHWHAQANEWAFVVKGRARATVIGGDGSSETNDFEAGDVWYFPRGHGHAVRCLGPEEGHFILVFDNGAVFEHGTFSLTDWMAHTPPEILTQSLGLPASTVAKLPREEVYIAQGRMPPPERPELPRQGMLKSSSLTHRYPLMAQRPAHHAGGDEWRVTVKEFPISTHLSGVILDLKPGAVREPHWHPHANEWFYFISGRARMTLFGSAGRARTEEFNRGDAGYIPQGFGHYIENVGDVPCRVLVAFDSGDYQEISVSTWLAANSTALVADNFKVPDELVAKLPDRRVFIATK